MNLERRILISYLIAFALVLGVFALAVDAAFVVDVRRDTRARLAELLDAGRSAVRSGPGGVRGDSDALRLVDPLSESIAWYDARGRLLRIVGARPPARGDSRAFDTRAAALARTADRRDASEPARVVVAVSVEGSQRLLRRLDLGLLTGFFIALAAAGIGGRYLARRSLARTAATIRTLRDFTADAAHELRGPLAALASNADAGLRDGEDLSAKQRRRLTTIAGTTADMAKTVDDLLLLARAETPLERELYAIDVPARVATAIEARRALAGEKQLALRSRPRPARLYGNPAEIDRIVGNLLDNAIRYTPPGGTIDVSCGPERAGIAIRVRDSGIGIAAADLPKIFERFWRADAARSHRSGTGLGLAIVRALARRHGGDVSVESALRTGSEFTVWLPSRPPQPAEQSGALEHPRR